MRPITQYLSETVSIVTIHPPRSGPSHSSISLRFADQMTGVTDVHVFDARHPPRWVHAGRTESIYELSDAFDRFSRTMEAQMSALTQLVSTLTQRMDSMSADVQMLKRQEGRE